MDGIDDSYEALFVDDGSTDRSAEILEAIRQRSPHLKILRLPKHQGKSVALQTALDHAEGDVMITIDADLQNDPSDIPKLLEKMREGFDLVCGWRKERYDQKTRKAASALANFFNKILFHAAIHDSSCGLKAFKKEMLKGIRLKRGMHRFLVAIGVRRGFRVGEVIVRHEVRRVGKSRYGFWDRFAESLVDFFSVYFRNFK